VRGRAVCRRGGRLTTLRIRRPVYPTEQTTNAKQKEKKMTGTTTGSKRVEITPKAARCLYKLVSLCEGELVPTKATNDALDALRTLLEEAGY
jgi:hypothetical protein